MTEPLSIIREQVARFAGVPVAALVQEGRGRRRHHWARQIGYWISRETTGASYRQIARAYGRAEHTTVRAGIRVVERHMCPELAELRDTCRAILEAA